MRTGKPYDIQPGEVYISPESMEVFKALYPVTGLGFVTKEWAELFLENWNRAVELWNNGELFKTYAVSPEDQLARQKEYARICCTWLIVHGAVEPHLVAGGF